MHRYFGILCFLSMLAIGDFNDEELTPEQKNWKGDPNRMPGRVTKTDSSALIIAIAVGVGTFLLLVAFIVIIIINKIKQKRAEEHLDRSMNFPAYSNSYEDVDTIQRSNEDIQLQSMNNNYDNQEDVTVKSTQQVNNTMLHGNEKSSEVSENETESENKEVAENLTFENETSTFSRNYHQVPEKEAAKEPFQKEHDEPLSQTDDLLPPPPPLEELDEGEGDSVPLKEVTDDELPRPPDDVESGTVAEEDWELPNETREDDPPNPPNEYSSTEFVNMDDTEKFSVDVKKTDEEPEQVDEISMPDEQLSKNSTESEPNEMDQEAEEPSESTYDNGFIKTTEDSYEDSTTNQNDSLVFQTNNIGAKAEEYDRSWIPPKLKDDDIIIITKDS